MALANLLRNKQADCVSNTPLDQLLQQNASTQLNKTVVSLGREPSIFEAEEEEEY